MRNIERLHVLLLGKKTHTRLCFLLSPPGVPTSPCQKKTRKVPSASQPTPEGGKRKKKPAAAFLSPTRDTKGGLCCSCESSLTMTLPSLPPSSPFPHRPRDPRGKGGRGIDLDGPSVGSKGNGERCTSGHSEALLVTIFFPQLFCILYSIWKLRFKVVIFL